MDHMEFWKNKKINKNASIEKDESEWHFHSTRVVFQYVNRHKPDGIFNYSAVFMLIQILRVVTVQSQFIQMIGNYVNSDAKLQLVPVFPKLTINER